MQLVSRMLENWSKTNEMGGCGGGGEKSERKANLCGLF